MINLVDISPAAHFRKWRFAVTLYFIVVALQIISARSTLNTSTKTFGEEIGSTDLEALVQRVFSDSLLLQIESLQSTLTPVVGIALLCLFTPLRYRAVLFAFSFIVWLFLNFCSAILRMRFGFIIANELPGSVAADFRTGLNWGIVGLMIECALVLFLANGAIQMCLLIARTDNTLYLVREGDLTSRHFADRARRRRETTFKIPLLSFSWRAIPFLLSGAALTIIGIALVATGAGLVGFGLGCFILSIGARHLVNFRRASSIAAEQLRQVDWRPPVVLIRSFGDDGLKVKSFSLFNPIRALARVGIGFEEFVARHLSRVGPVIAITGESNELAPIGAARHVADETSWRDRILTLFDEARVVVVIVGETPSLIWEIGEALANGHGPKLIFLFPPIEIDDLQKRWTALTPILQEGGLDGPRNVKFPYSTSWSYIRSLTHQVDRQGRYICFVGDGDGTSSFDRALEAAIGIAADASYRIRTERAPRSVSSA